MAGKPTDASASPFNKKHRMKLILVGTVIVTAILMFFFIEIRLAEVPSYPTTLN